MEVSCCGGEEVEVNTHSFITVTTYCAIDQVNFGQSEMPNTHLYTIVKLNPTDFRCCDFFLTSQSFFFVVADLNQRPPYSGARFIATCPQNRACHSCLTSE